MLYKLALLAIAGALGTLCRYGLAGAIQRAFGADFPYGTLVVNILGCLAAGLVWSLLESRFTLSGEARIVVLVGFLGAFTTFSTLVLESSNFMRDGEWVRAAVNLISHNVVGVLALFAGLGLGRWV